MLLPLLCCAAVVGGALFVPWLMRPENLRNEKDRLRAFLFGTFYGDAYQAESLLLVDLSDGTAFLSQREDEPQVPASLAKLFVVEYAATLAGLDEVVPVTPEAVALTRPGSSVAGIEAGDYYLHNLLAAMLVPSGNDAAYAVADYCGGILSPQAAPGRERVDAFMEGLGRHLEELGCDDTVLYDPSGFDEEARTTALDLVRVAGRLLEQPWFREMVCQSSYTAVLPDGSAQTWQNTNAFLDPASEYYNENVAGIKTGSLWEDYNLMVLYRMHGKEFLICSLGSQSDASRYDDVSSILATIDQSSYLAG